MKRVYLLSVLFICSFTINAQLNPVLKSKRGLVILPEKGDYSFGISANPFIDYLGNFIKGANSPSVDYLSNQSFYGKYMVSDKKAIRGSFRFGVNTSSQTIIVKDLGLNATIDGKVENKINVSSFDLQLGLGVEHRRGDSRLQGIYGYEGFLIYNSGNLTKNKFGNELKNEAANLQRTTSINIGNSLTLGARVFAGAELFLAPKFSLGFELGFGPRLTFRSSSYTETEIYDVILLENVSTKTQTSNRTTSFSLDTDYINSQLRLNFFF